MIPNTNQYPGVNSCSVKIFTFPPEPKTPSFAVPLLTNKTYLKTAGMVTPDTFKSEMIMPWEGIVLVI